MNQLPDEILGLVCTQLRHQRDYNTLFNCACSGERLAIIAIENLYRTQDVVPVNHVDNNQDSDSDGDEDEDGIVGSDKDEDGNGGSDEDEDDNGGSNEDTTNGGSDDEIPVHDGLGRIIDGDATRSLKERIVLNCASFWRTITLSSLGKTFYSYSHYIWKLYRRENGGRDDEIAVHDRLGRINNGDAMRSSRERIIIKCAGLWRTITLSSLGKTFYPYSRFIRTLNLRELEELLGAPKFRARNSKYAGKFFHDELAQFEVDLHRLGFTECANRIAEVIMKQTPLLEEIIGDITIGALSRSIPRLPRLKYLEVWYDAATQDTGALIRLHCPLFKGLHFRHWWGAIYNPDDEKLAAFLSELRPQSIESFNSCLSGGEIEAKTCQALNFHGESLTKLTLHTDMLGVAIPSLHIFKACTNLVSLSLTGKGLGNLDFESLWPDTVPGALNWLKECKKLRILALISFLKPAWIAPIFSENSIRITSFVYGGDGMPDTEDFYRALANQTSLQSLWMYGYMKGHSVEADVVVESLSKLVNLTDLRLAEISFSFLDQHIVQLAGSLPKLEKWSTQGCKLTDAIWAEVSSLRSLQALVLEAVTSFTVDGVLGFIEKLGPGNEGLILYVGHKGKGSNLLLVEQVELIQDKIAKEVNGKFVLQTWG